MGLLEPPFWQELFHFHGDFGEKIEIHMLLLRIVQNEPPFRNPASSPAIPGFAIAIPGFLVQIKIRNEIL